MDIESIPGDLTSSVREVSPPVFLPGDAVNVRGDGSCELIGTRCRECGWTSFPPSPVCGQCMSDAVVEETMPNVGVVYSVSTVHVGPKHWKLPMTVGYVDFPNGVRIFTHLDSSTEIGDKVSPSIAVVGQGQDGLLFETFVFKSRGG